MKYYKFNEEMDWKSILSEIEKAEELGGSADLIETEMLDLIRTTQPKDVDDIDESIDGLYVDEEEVDESLDGNYVFAYVVKDDETIYEFEFDLDDMK